MVSRFIFISVEWGSQYAECLITIFVAPHSASAGGRYWQKQVSGLRCYVGEPQCCELLP